MNPLNPPIREWTNRKVWLVGASSGIGLVTANKLIEKGATLIAAVRNVAKARAVLNPKAQIQELDLADLDSVKRFANNLKPETIEIPSDKHI